jgi:DNA repair protein RadA/Sms
MQYFCESCQYRSGRWMGFCPQCQIDQPLTEETKSSVTVRKRKTTKPAVVSLKTGGDPPARLSTNIGELDRVLGGGLVPGAVILLGGEPGVGKSSLLLQVAGQLAGKGREVLLATAEESAEQVSLRARRLGVDSDHVRLVADDDVDGILAVAADMKPSLMIIDSIQTVRVADSGGATGAVSQVRESSGRIIRFAKDHNIPTVLVGHVTKDGGIAGPRMLEHMVDVVAYLEGDTDRGLRVLHSLKNRFGATNISGLFEMTPEGLLEVPDPSAAFVGGWDGAAAGSVVFPTVQGRRTFLVEVQALVVPSQAQSPRRSIRGIESARVHQLLAVLQRSAGINYSAFEVYVSVVGGFSVREPAADAAVAIALVSAFKGQPVGRIAAWGEVGLTGEVRAVPAGDRRAAEASRLGLTSIGPSDHAVLPEMLAAAKLL